MKNPSTTTSSFLPLFMRAAWCAVLVLSVASCGFSLRGSQALPDSLTTVVINAPLQYSPISRALQDRLPVYQLNSVTYIEREQTANAQDTNSMVELTLQPEQFERRLLSVFTTGQVAEYELVYTVRYQVTFPNAAPITNTLSVTREYQDDPDQVLAKSRELDAVLSDLRRDAADRIIRMLSSQYASSTNMRTLPAAQKVN